MGKVVVVVVVVVVCQVELYLEEMGCCLYEGLLKPVQIGQKKENNLRTSEAENRYRVTVKNLGSKNVVRIPSTQSYRDARVTQPRS